jgi:hypothetical protein
MVALALENEQMPVSQSRKRMPAMDVDLLEQVHIHGRLNKMVIVSNYELFEKSPGVFGSTCRSGDHGI